MTDLFKGFRYLMDGFSLITKPGIRKYAIVPLLINTLLFTAVIVFGANAMGDFINSLTGWWQVLEWLIWPLFVLVTLTVVFFTFSIMANLVGSPFNGFLAEAVEIHLLAGKQPASYDSGRLVQEIIKAIRSESTKFLYFISRAIPLLILMLIPGLQVLWIVFGAWMLALEYIDYPMGNHGYTFRDERTRLKQRRMLSFGFGGSVMFMTLIPFLNFIVMPVAVAGATKLWLQEFSHD